VTKVIRMVSLGVSCLSPRVERGVFKVRGVCVCVQKESKIIGRDAGGGRMDSGRPSGISYGGRPSEYVLEIVVK
jgi:hypothetical protein